MTKVEILELYIRDLESKVGISPARNNRIAMLKDELNKALETTSTNEWVAITDNHSPERCTEVMIKHEDGWMEVAYFDGDGRFYRQNNDDDITDLIAAWHKLP